MIAPRRTTSRFVGGAALALTVAACAASDPAEFARERGAIERLTSWPCAGSAHFIAVAGGDLKTDWTATRLPDGSYRVTLRTGATLDTWRLDAERRTVTPETEGARASWSRCAAP